MRKCVMLNVPEKMLRMVVETLMPLLGFFLFLALVAMILNFVIRYAWGVS